MILYFKKKIFINIIILFKNIFIIIILTSASPIISPLKTSFCKIFNIIPIISGSRVFKAA